MKQRKPFPVLLISMALILSACLSQPALPSSTDDGAEPTGTRAPFTTTNLVIPGWNRLLPYDGIRPVYQPEFTTPEEASAYLQGSELVMGVAWEGKAKAYPVTVLHRREMVNDEMAGIPYLVSW